MQKVFSTRQASTILQIRPQRLQTAAWDGTVKSPAKSPAGNFMWSIEDVESAAWALRRYRQFKRWRQQQEGAAK